MGKARKEEQWRLEGIAYALRFLESHDGDLDALRDDLKMRGALNMPLVMSKNEWQVWRNEIYSDVFHQVALIALVVLHDEFGFGNGRRKGESGRLDRYMTKFKSQAESLKQKRVSWTDAEKIVADEFGIVLK